MQTAGFPLCRCCGCGWRARVRNVVLCVHVQRVHNVHVHVQVHVHACACACVFCENDICCVHCLKCGASVIMTQGSNIFMFPW